MIRYSTLQYECEMDGHRYFVEADRKTVFVPCVEGDARERHLLNVVQIVESDVIDNVWVQRDGGGMVSIGDLHPNEAGQLMARVDRWRDINIPEGCEND